jgi:hypothetical protein
VHHQVGALGEAVGGGRALETDAEDAPRAVLDDGSLTGEGLADGQQGAPAEFGEFGLGVGVDDAAAGDDEGTLGPRIAQS